MAMSMKRMTTPIRIMIAMNQTDEYQTTRGSGIMPPLPVGEKKKNIHIGGMCYQKKPKECAILTIIHLR